MNSNEQRFDAGLNHSLVSMAESAAQSLTCKVLVGKVVQKHHDWSSVVGINHTRAGIDRVL
jgi:hypothetical protein